MSLDKEMLDLGTEPAAGPRPNFFDDPAMDRVWDVLVALTTELAVTRTRLDSLERVLAEYDCVPTDAVEQWQADEATAMAQAQAQQELLMRVFRGLAQDVPGKA